MVSRTLVLRRLLSGVLVSCLVAALGAPSALAAGATVTRFSWDVTYTFEGSVPSECLSPDLTATYGPVHDFGSGQTVENGTGLIVEGKGGIDYAFDLSDGRRVEGFARGHFSYVAHGAVIVITDEVREPRTIYGADGTIDGRVMIHFLSHVVYDATTGTVRTSAERFFFTCTD